MKTFEERYTEWVDGQLQGAALVAFEEELARRAQAGEAQAEKAGAAQLRALLREHLQAPALSNTEFFNHQLRERIERDGSGRRRAAVERPEAKAPWWSFARLGLSGAAAVFVGGALYYGLIPERPASRAPEVAQNRLAPAPPTPVEALAPAPEPVSAPARPGSPVELAKLEDVSRTPDLEVRTLDDSTSATPLTYKAPNTGQNVQVLWMNGLEYQADDAPAAAPAP